LTFTFSILNDADVCECFAAQLQSCKEEIHNIMGDNVQESIVEDVIIQNKFNIEATLNQLLSANGLSLP
jgi:hypothetical protein